MAVIPSDEAPDMGEASPDIEFGVEPEDVFDELPDEVPGDVLASAPHAIVPKTTRARTSGRRRWLIHLLLEARRTAVKVGLES
jgi:hypothetical protein